MKDLDTIPPVINLLRDNLTELDSFDCFYKQFKKLSTEISRQAEWSYNNFEYYEDKKEKSKGLVITAAGGLNPFSEFEICSEINCRIKTTREIVRTLGLYGDVILLSDPFSYPLANTEKYTDSTIYSIYSRLLVLKELKPLIDEGIIKFWSGSLEYCIDCHNTMQKKIDDGVNEIFERINNFISTELKKDHLTITTNGPLDSKYMLVQKLSKKDKKYLKSGGTQLDLGKKLYKSHLNAKIRSTLYELNFSQYNSSMLMSTSRSELYALNAFDKNAPSLNELAVWEKARSIQLPWVNNLNAEQIIRLKHAASDALPSFRETFLRHVANPNSNINSINDKIMELRESASQVERELKAINPAGEHAFRNIAGSLGITISVYGFASGFASPIAALGGLMSLLGLIHKSAKHDNEKLSMLKSHPGYVLVKAKEFSEHAPN